MRAVDKDSLLDLLANALRECSEDLQGEIDARYGGLQDKYPDMLRKYLRDIEPITNARKLLAEKYNDKAH